MTPSQILASAGSVRARAVGRRRHRGRDARVRVPGEPPQQLLPGEAARAGDADPHGVCPRRARDGAGRPIGQ